MKKIIAIALAALMVFAFVACADKGGNETETTTSSEELTSSAAVEEAETAEDAGKLLYEDFKKALAENAEITDADLGRTLMGNETVGLMGDAMEVEEGDLMGFKAPVTGFKSGAQFMPMIGTIPFMGYIFTLNDAADADAFVKTLKENANPRWNICTEADSMMVEANGDRVFFLMYPADLLSDAADAGMEDDMMGEDMGGMAL